MRVKKLVCMLTLLAVLFGAVNIGGAITANAGSGIDDPAGNTRPLVIWTWDKDAADDAIEIYHNTIDADASFKVIFLSPAEMKTGFNSATKLGMGLPDILLVNDSDVGGYVNKYQELFLPLDLDQSDYMDFKIMEAATGDGMMYAVPYNSQPAALYYRRDIAETYGIYDMNGLTWDEFREIGMQMREYESDLWLFPADWNTREILMKSSGFANLDSDGTRAAMNVLNMFYNDGLIDPSSLSATTDEIYDQLVTGQVFSVIGGTHWVNTLEAAYEQDFWGEWGVTQIPKNEVLYNDVNTGGASWMVLDNDNSLFAVDFLTQTYGGSAELAAIFAEKQNAVSSYKAAQDQLNMLPAADHFYYGEDRNDPDMQNVMTFLFELCFDIPWVDYIKYPQNAWLLLEQYMSAAITSNDPDQVFQDFLMEFCELGELEEEEFDDEYELPAHGGQPEYDSYFSNNNISDEYCEQISESVRVQFEPYVYLNSRGRLVFDKSGLIFSSDFDTASADMVDRNIEAMNELVDEGVAVIDESKELVFTDEEAADTWRVWGFYIKWNKLGAKFGSGYAIIFSIVGLVANVILNIKDMAGIAAKIGESGAFAAIIYDLFFVLPTDIASGIVGYFNDILGYLCGFVPIIIGLLTATGGPITIILALILPIILPSIVDCAIVLYNACKHSKGADLKVCWVPWFGDKWGLSLKSI